MKLSISALVLLSASLAAASPRPHGPEAPPTNFNTTTTAAAVAPPAAPLAALPTPATPVPAPPAPPVVAPKPAAPPAPPVVAPKPISPPVPAPPKAVIPPPPPPAAPVPAKPSRLYTLVCNSGKQALNLRDMQKCRDEIAASKVTWAVTSKTPYGSLHMCNHGGVFVTGRALDNKAAKSPTKGVVAALDEIIGKCGTRGGSDSYPGKAEAQIQNFIVHINSKWI